MNTGLFFSYLAGFIDAEGCFSTHMVGGGSSDYLKYPRSELSVTNSEYELLLIIQDIIGGKVRKKSRKNKGHRQLYQFIMHSGDLMNFIPKILNQLIVKKGQAALLRGLLRTKRTKSLGIKLSDYIVKKRESIVSKVRSLKRVEYKIDSIKLKGSFELSEQDLAYIAGFLDGDGTLGINYSEKNKSTTLSFFNNNPKVLLWIGNKIGSSLLKQKKRSTDVTQPYILNVSAENMRIILPKLLPFLMSKKGLAEIMINFWVAKTKEEKIKLFGEYKKEIENPDRVSRAMFQSSIYA